LQEVEAFESVLNGLVSDITSQVDQLQSAAIDIWNQGQELGVQDNSYSPLTPDDLSNTRAALDMVRHHGLMSVTTAEDVD
jgi:hypothetical protein